MPFMTQPPYMSSIRKHWWLYETALIQRPGLNAPVKDLLNLYE